LSNSVFPWYAAAPITLLNTEFLRFLLKQMCPKSVILQPASINFLKVRMFPAQAAWMMKGDFL
jgi:hypothetical protein